MRTHLKRIAVLLALCVIAGSCGDDSSDSSSDEPATVKAAADAPGLPIVALGDSGTTGSGDPTGKGWVGRYARLLRTRLGLEVKVTNLAADGKTSAELLSDVRDDPTTRAALENAQVVLLGLG
jgi:lysophospholipase L1-like esterase